MRNNNIYVKQVFEEGLGTIFYQKPKAIIEKNCHNIFLKKVFSFLIGILYILFIITVSILLFLSQFPL